MNALKRASKQLFSPFFFTNNQADQIKKGACVLFFVKNTVESFLSRLNYFINTPVLIIEI